MLRSGTSEAGAEELAQETMLAVWRSQFQRERPQLRVSETIDTVCYKKPAAINSVLTQAE